MTVAIVALAALSMAMGGTVAVLAAFVALVAIADRLFPVVMGPGTHNAEASFRRQRRSRRRDERMRRLRRAPDQASARPYLAHLAEDDGWAALAERRPLGVHPIRVESIVGTVERQKAVAFDGQFRPPDWSRERWARLWLAAQRGVDLPPISVYRVGDEHYVRDGHHRVSVARALGAVATDAEVVELRAGGRETAKAA